MELAELVAQLHEPLPHGMAYQSVARLADDGILQGDGYAEEPQVLLQSIEIPFQSVCREVNMRWLGR